jgi:hypothetical protein
MRLLGAVCLSSAFLLVVAPAYSQSRPDFSGTWTEVAPASGKSATSMVVRQDADTISIDVPPGQHWSANLDGSPSTSVNVQETAPVTHVTTAIWEGTKLILSTRVRLAGGIAATIRQVWSLDDKHLIIASTTTDDSTGKILQDVKQTFSR